MRKFLFFSAILSSFVSFADTTPIDSIGNTDYLENQFIIQPLFEYVIAPDDLPDLQSRTNYLMDHFWDPFDFKNTKTVDQNALNHAFGVYAQAMPFASQTKVNASIKNLIKQIKNNPGLSYQFAKAADENLYGPRADLWGDEIFMEFAQNLVDNKKIRDSLKKPFSDKLSIVRKFAIGAVFPDLNLTNLDGGVVTFSPSKEFTLISFSPAESESNYPGLKLDISSVVNDLLDDGRLEVDIIILDNSDKKYSFPQKWNVFRSGTPKSEMDIRISPSFYVVGPDKKIAGKNLSVDDAIGLIESLSKK